jgi:hypothetical protein
VAESNSVFLPDLPQIKRFTAIVNHVAEHTARLFTRYCLVFEMLEIILLLSSSVRLSTCPPSVFR